MLQVMLPGLSGSNNTATTGIFGGTVANNGVGWVQDVGNVLIDTVSFEIGGQQIDRQYGQWLEIYSQLSLTEEKLLGYNEMVGHWRTRAGAIENSVYSKFYYVPLMFYWNLFVGLSLPLIALQYHEVRILFEFAQFGALVKAFPGTGQTATAFPPNSSTASNTNISINLYIDYIYLDTAERRRFAQMAHEYLITQLQLTNFQLTTQGVQNLTFNFNHPCKFLAWVAQLNSATNSDATTDAKYNEWFNFSNLPPNVSGVALSGYYGNPGDLLGPYVTGQVGMPTNNGNDCTILLNGQQIFAARPINYFRLVQPFLHFTRVPRKHIYVYSFALRPEEHQPSGTINFSRIDNSQLAVYFSNQIPAGTSAASQLFLYAVNYNVLRIMSGMGKKSKLPVKATRYNYLGPNYRKSFEFPINKLVRVY